MVTSTCVTNNTPETGIHVHVYKFTYNVHIILFRNGRKVESIAGQ